MGVLSDGNPYGIPSDLVFSFPMQHSIATAGKLQAYLHYYSSKQAHTYKLFYIVHYELNIYPCIHTYIHSVIWYELCVCEYTHIYVYVCMYVCM